MIVKTAAVLVKAFTIVFLFIHCGCDSPGGVVTGSWKSVAVTSSSPFFKGVVSSYREGDITVCFYPDSKFTWADARGGINLKGTFTNEGKFLAMIVTKDDEIIRVSYRIKRNRLVISTDDSFTFTFEKEIKTEGKHPAP
ncbi:MAG TPA: hypothetical protein PK926_12865 [Spirochaetota bacterium]|nr:hypothetical protein [Spirochaetota bacterium]HPI89931.1 hypothetical protein [Spirochaetota bacterium]HPR49049.1 hypothetical protein [Spirochaetota bacterium]